MAAPKKPAKHPGGRPSKLTPEVIQKLEYAFSIGASVNEACLYADIGRSTFFEWQQDNPKLADRFETLRDNPIFVARESVYKGIKRDPKLALDFLGRKAKKEFGTNVDITTDGKALPTPILGGATKQVIEDAKDERTDSSV